ncbi:MAG: PD-(D/E)XK nuclease family protein [Bacilli bacterium]|nr:PD-(D/E)XK nuclease family protein [Bacilli bacterium]
MDNKIIYISPSSFYYWNRCPLRALYSKKYKNKQIFPKNPDSDIGTLIHKLYTKNNVNDKDSFNKIWEQEIRKINGVYLTDILQARFYPIQWYSKYYVVKKQLLYKYINNKKYREGSKASSNNSNISLLYEKWINNDHIGGCVDLLIKQNDEVREIIDFKTGNIFEIKNNKREIRTAYKYQLALYCAVISEHQNYTPDLFIETLDGVRHQIYVDQSYINDLASKAIELKKKINFVVESGNIASLAQCNSENCKNCNYRVFCKSYKSNLINTNLGGAIDISGVILAKTNTEIQFDTGLAIFTIKNIKILESLSVGDKTSIYNLYYPDNEQKILYTLNNTIIYND